MPRHVILGNSHAAISAVEAIRSVNQGDEITLVSREDCPAYSPMLTPLYLSGRLPYMGMFFCAADFYEAHRVRTVLGKAAMRVDPTTGTVSLDDGTAIPYDDLLIATGSTSWIPSIPGRALPNVFSLWTAQDAEKIRGAMGKAQRVAIVGAGLIGIDCVNAMVEAGKAVVLIEALAQVLPQALDDEAATLVEARMRAQGVELHLNDGIRTIERNQEGLRMSLASGSHVQADLVIIATGVRPNVSLLEGSGVRVATGVIVNERCETSVPGVYAAGDVAESVDGVTGELRVNATIPNAVEQGRVAGLNMAGQQVSCLRNVPLNAFTPLGMPCVSVGVIREQTGRHRVVSYRSGGSYRKLVFERERLVGAVLVGDVDAGGVLANRIERGEPCPGLAEDLARGRIPVPYPRGLVGVA